MTEQRAMKKNPRLSWLQREKERQDNKLHRYRIEKAATNALDVGWGDHQVSNNETPVFLRNQHFFSTRSISHGSMFFYYLNSDLALFVPKRQQI